MLSRTAIYDYFCCEVPYPARQSATRRGRISLISARMAYFSFCGYGREFLEMSQYRLFAAEIAFR